MSPADPGQHRLVLINPNTSTPVTAAMVEIAAEAAGRSAAVTGITAPFGAPLITEPKALALAADAVAAIPREAFANAAGVIVAAFGDPGVDALRARLNVPVVGIAEAAMRAASAVGRFSVVTTTPLLAASIRLRAVSLGLDGRLASVRATRQDPVQLTADETALRAALLELIGVAIAEDGAEAIIIGGGPLAVAARALAAHSPVPLFEPVPIAVQAVMARLALRGPA